MKCWLCGFSLLMCATAFSQLQTCPANINFSTGDLTHWQAYTGNNRDGNGPNAIKKYYDSLSSSPNGTLGASVILEYNLTQFGIQIVRQQGRDPFGGFQTIPTINGYQYNYSILLGSTAVSRGIASQNTNTGGVGTQTGNLGGYIRGISYKISVPAGSKSEPYTMTYAYAMVLENGTHNSDQQPLFSAKLSTHDSVITCASPSYYLPTSSNVSPGARGATLDTTAARKNGFILSSVPTPNGDPVQNGAPVHLRDVWTKGWTEVTFDLSPYRGQQVTLTFEADNCIPGGHFAYAYVALRNSCAGLDISGNPEVCVGSDIVYSIPALAGASYQWIVPQSWQITSQTDTSNIIHVIAGAQPGFIIAKEQNSCAKLQDTISVKTLLPGKGGNVAGDATVCAGDNNSTLILKNSFGNILKWLSSTDSVHWQDISNTAASYDAVNLDKTTTFRALVGNGNVCVPDTSSGATIIVDPHSVGGKLDPAKSFLCDGEDIGSIIKLAGQTGDVVNWQSSVDNINWSDFSPQFTNTVYAANGLSVSTSYRTIVKNGVCPADTSSVASVQKIDVPFPQAITEPDDTTICYGATAQLNAVIKIGTSYTWDNTSTLTNQGNGNITSTPNYINAKATPLSTTDYVLSVANAGCPNLLLDTFHVNVLPEIIVDAGNDTSVVANQPLQLNATANQEGANWFTWTPSTNLSDPNIPNPIAIFSINDDVIKYTVRASTEIGCYGEKSITVKVFKTGPDIFVPNAFTPDGISNRVFRPIPVGVGSLQYFRIYNRSGQLVYSTSQIGQGWDGIYGGKPQDTGGYVWMVAGTDYLGNKIFKKGVFVLIR
ncbi:MAG: gliding motility-associated C-terminal domain-containing protein [Bacteroidetes bacterium]|nr:gliding motility-associated C-terminal domain-containing protein [Bacteroidota bacterium]